MVARSDGRSPRVLISPAGSLGRTVLTIPLVQALRAHFPDALIVWATSRPAAAILRGHAAIDRILLLPDRRYPSPKSLSRWRAELRSFQFQVSIDCLGTFGSASLGWLAAASRRIGFGTGGRLAVSRQMNNTLVQPVFTHLTDRALELLIPLEIHSPRVHWNLPLSEPARLWASRWRRSMAGSSLAVFNPGAGCPGKLWESDRYAATARYLRDRYGYRSVIAWGSEAERQIAQLIVFQSCGAATLAPDTDLQYLAALIGQADLFVGTDSAPLHLAAALSVPSIGLYGASRPSVSGPYGQIAICQATESESRTHRRRVDNAAMRRIGVDHLCHAIDQLEAQRPVRQAA